MKDRVRRFCEERDWDQYHHPKDLVLGLMTESAELAEIFRFKTDEQISAMLASQKDRTRIGEELADTLYFLLRFAQRYDINIAEEFDKKMRRNEERYPVGKVKGLNKKYNEY
jgi:NTP pyrophosphatase (non-canonical NTP hydrolase)